MPASDVVDVQIIAQTGGLSVPGFGTPLILGGYSKTYPERVRFYSDLPSVAADFAAGTPEYLAAQAIFAQNPHPTRLAVGRCALPPTQRWTVTPVVTNQAVTTYKVWIGGVAYSFTSDATPTAAEVVTGLTAAVNAATATHGLTASGVATLVLTGAAGAWQSVKVDDVNLLRIVQDHADPGIAIDLAAIVLETSDWYALVNPWNSTAEVLAIAAWAEANGKFFLAETQETEVIDTADATANDVAHQLKALAYRHTACVYDPDNSAFLDAGMLGACLPLDPGSETWALKTIAGVPARNHTATQLANLRAKNCGWYYTIFGRNVTQQGKTADAEFIDTIRFIDWQTIDIQSRVFLAMANAKKIPYTDAGATIIQGQVIASLEAGETVGGLVPGSSVVTVLKVSAQNPIDRANREMGGVEFTAGLQGAAHLARIRGTVTA
jgi:hypothetical protein